ncbi:esterase FE4-like [Epargyreus clarus]|uniref:esterase FE4-like n=1 Tax=Epargyreus clarus TaxID=520877 RepID=UPI003C2E41B6
MTRLCGLIEFLQLFILNDVFIQCSFNEIHLPQGKIRGIQSFSDHYRAYLGIPYATIIERFQDPGPPPRWDKTFNAVESLQCQQTERTSSKLIGQENCLVLNVFTPTGIHKKPLPVLVFIHGGGFSYGSNSHHIYHPKYLIKHGIIVVTINYRLGPFGFLCLQIPEAPGNAAIKDQVAALRWIQNNIHYFGGNPQSVTLFGQSVGASIITYLLLSPETIGLFQHAIVASGSLLVPYSLANDPIGTASRVAHRMGYKTNDPNELLQIYRNASADDLLKASYFEDLNDPLAPYVFKPCIDKSDGSIIKHGPREILKSPITNRNSTIIIGFNNKEGIKWAERYDHDGLKELNNDFSKIIPYNLLFANEEEKLAFVAAVKEFYFKNQTIGRNDYDPMIDYFSDSIIMYPLTAMTKYFLRANMSVYNYYFQYDCNRNRAKQKTKLASIPGSTHGDELGYTFDSDEYSERPPTPNDATVIDVMTSLWSNVAKTGNPSTDTIKWIPSNIKDLKFLSIDKKVEMIPLPNRERMLFWKGIYAKYNSY